MGLALLLAMATFALTYGLVIAVYLVADPLSYDIWRWLMAILIGVLVTVQLAALVVTWLKSRLRAQSRPWFSRWYGVLGVLIISVAVGYFSAEVAKSRYQQFSIPSEAMAPTLKVGEAFVANMTRPVPVERGDLVVFANRGTDFVKRVVGLPGDRVSISAGFPTINGISPIVALVGKQSVSAYFAEPGTIYRETLPGEQSSHLIVDQKSAGSADRFAEVTVPRGSIYVLGDNRDNSADSRFSQHQGGAGFVPLDAVKGRVLFFTRSADAGRLGQHVR